MTWLVFFPWSCPSTILSALFVLTKRPRVWLTLQRIQPSLNWKKWHEFVVGSCPWWTCEPSLHLEDLVRSNTQAAHESSRVRVGRRMEGRIIILFLHPLQLRHSLTRFLAELTIWNGVLAHKVTVSPRHFSPDTPVLPLSQNQYLQSNFS